MSKPDNEASTVDEVEEGTQKGILGAVERIGNKVPHPALMFWPRQGSFLITVKKRAIVIL